MKGGKKLRRLKNYQLFNKGVSVKHTVAIPNGFKTLERPHVRYLGNVRLYCALLIIAILAWALALIELWQTNEDTNLWAWNM